MFKPHHKSYAAYFKAVHNRARPKVYQRKRLDLEVLIHKLQTAPCSANEFHFLFYHFKNVLNLGPGTYGGPDFIKTYVKMVQRGSLSMSHDDSLPLSKQDAQHPWRFSSGVTEKVEISQ